MARTDAQRERHAYRKTQTMLEQTHGGNAGRSILEMLTEQLDVATRRYMSEMTGGTQKGVLIARGEIRGLARAISLMQNPYHPTRGIKQVEKDSADRVRRERAREQQTAQEAEECG